MQAFVRTGLLLIACVASGTQALAQGIAKNLDELRLLTRVGETVTLSDGSGQRTSGRITALSPSAITLQTPAGPREWTQDEIVRIAQRRGDSLSNGALWGLGIGAGLAGVAVALVGVEDGDAGYAAAAIGFYGGAGAGIGVGIDALIRRTYPIYEKPATSAQWRLAPFFGRRANGLALTLRF